MISFGVGGVSPLWAAGFVGNPFRTLTDEEWEVGALLSAPIAAAFYHRPVMHLQIMGAAGAGKSSALRAIRREARQGQMHAVYEYIPDGADRFRAQVAPNTLFCLDEAQRLNSSERYRLMTMAQHANIRLCLGTHEDMAPLLRAAGLATQTVLIEDRTPDDYAAIWTKRLARFARQGAAYAVLDSAAIHHLQTRFRDDLRSAERFLYRYFQEKVNTPREITESDLAGASF